MKGAKGSNSLGKHLEYRKSEIIYVQLTRDQKNKQIILQNPFGTCDTGH